MQQFFRRKFPYGFLLMICLIIIFLYIAFIKLMVLDLSNWNTASIVIFMIIYHVVFLLFIFSLIMTMATDPGKVPVQWVLLILINILGFYYEQCIKKILFNLSRLQTIKNSSLWHTQQMCTQYGSSLVYYPFISIVHGLIHVLAFTIVNPSY